MANHNPPNNLGDKRRTTAGPGRPKGKPNALNRTRVEQELRHIALFDPRRLLFRTGKHAHTFTLAEIARLPDDVARCIASFDVVLGNQDKSDGALETIIKVRWYDKVKALELCAKALGMLKEVHVVEGLDERKARLRAALAPREVLQLTAGADGVFVPAKREEEP